MSVLVKKDSSVSICTHRQNPSGSSEVKDEHVETHTCQIPWFIFQFLSLMWRINFSLPMLRVVTAYLLPPKSSRKGRLWVQEFALD